MSYLCNTVFFILDTAFPMDEQSGNSNNIQVKYYVFMINNFGG
jgi:hypothetical protein